MIVVSRLNGERFGLNAEHIERVEETPDTVITLVEGKKYLVRESLDDIIDAIVAYRARIMRVSYSPASGAEPALQLVDTQVSRTSSTDGDA